MKGQTKMADELKLDIPLSPYEFGRWVFHNQRALQKLTANGPVKPWQLAFFAGWESFLRQADKQFRLPSISSLPDYCRSQAAAAKGARSTLVQNENTHSHLFPKGDL